MTGSGARVLVVDDERAIQRALKATLEAAIPGYRMEVDAENLRQGDLDTFRADAFDLQRVQTEVERGDIQGERAQAETQRFADLAGQVSQAEATLQQIHEAMEALKE